VLLPEVVGEVLDGVEPEAVDAGPLRQPSCTSRRNFATSGFSVRKSGRPPLRHWVMSSLPHSPLSGWRIQSLNAGSVK